MKRCPACRRIYDRFAQVCLVDGTALSDTALNADPLVGQTIAQRYQMIRKLGGGSLGSVYLAEELATGNKVAVKVVLSEFRRDQEFVKHLWWEARLAAASHVANVRVFEVDRTEDGRVFIVMEYLKGKSLSEIIGREGGLELGRALRLATQIAQSLAAASKAGVTHRNLKPENVIIVAPDEQVKLTDFGVARLRETGVGGRLISFGVVGSEYVSPEQRGGGEVGERTDIFALGAVLYAMLTGSAHPMRSGSVTSQLRAPVRKLRPGVPAAFEQFILRAMEQEPELRHSNWEEFIEGLRDLSASVTAGPSMLPMLLAAPDSTNLALPGRASGGGEPFLGGPKPVMIGFGHRRLPEDLWQARVDRWERTLTGLVSRWLPWDLDGKDGLPIPGSRVPAASLGSARLGGRMLAMTGLAALVVGGAMTWAVLEWKSKAGSPSASPTAQDLQRDTAEEARMAEQARQLQAADEARQRETEELRRRQEIARQVPAVPRQDQDSGRAALDTAARQRADSRQAEIDRRQAEIERRRAEVQAAEDRRRRLEVEAARRSEEDRRQLEASRRAAEADRRRLAEARQAEIEAARRQGEAELAARRQAEAEAARRQAEAEAARRQAEAETARRQAEAEVARRQAEAEAARARAEAAQQQVARAVEPPPARPPLPTLSAQDLTRIRNQAEQRLISRGLYRVSSSDRWGVSLEVGTLGDVTLSGNLRDMALYDEAVRLVKEIPGVQDVKSNVRVSDGVGVLAAQRDLARIRAEIQQRLRGRGLLRETSSDRWGVSVEVSAEGEVTLSGSLRDAGLQAEAVRIAQGVQGVTQVKQDIRLTERAIGQ